MDLIFSDIHADISALNKITYLALSDKFKEKYGSISRIINLGDLLERGTHPKQVLEKMTLLSQNYPVISVMGNHDEAFLYRRKVSGSSLESIDAHETLNAKDIEFFEKNQDETFGKHDFFDKKSGVVCVHGGPIEPKNIIPKDAGKESWLYQKCWQRLSSEKEFFSYFGYHYTAESAFRETKEKIAHPIIFCGHQHTEAVISQNNNGIHEIFTKTKSQTEKLAGFVVEKKEFQVESNNSYLIRVGLGGPEGYYGIGETKPHFGIYDKNSKKAILFSINLD